MQYIGWNLLYYLLIQKTIAHLQIFRLFPLKGKSGQARMSGGYLVCEPRKAIWKLWED